VEEIYVVLAVLILMRILSKPLSHIKKLPAGHTILSGISTIGEAETNTKFHSLS
jgi:hypothetical protein